MPQRLKKPCAYNGCPELVEAGITYCEKHRKEVKGAMDRKYNQNNRDKKLIKFYNSTAWKKLRKMKKAKDPLCEHCFKKERITPATEIDHIIPIKVNWDKRLDMKNLQSLCYKCHRVKTMKDKKKYKL